MRRELLFPLGGFLVGFAVAAMVFWQRADSPNGAAAAVSEAVSHDAALGPRGEQSHRRVGVALRDAAESAPMAEGARRSQSAAEAFHEMLGELKDLDADGRQSAMDALVKQLVASGPEGLQVVWDYLRAGQDVIFRNGYARVNGVQVESLRMAMLHALGKWPDDEGIEIVREVLRTTPRMTEAFAAIVMTEQSKAGVDRAEAILTMQKLAAAFELRNAYGIEGREVFYLMARLKSSELVPAAETVVSRSPRMAKQFVDSLGMMSADVRRPVLQRLLSNEAVSQSFAQNAGLIRALDYAEPVVAENVARIFASNADKHSREEILKVLGEPSVRGFTDTDPAAKMRSRVAFLEIIAPQCNTPVLQERLQDARESLQKAIASPGQSGLSRSGSGTLILSGANTRGGGGTTIISPGTLQISPAAKKQ